MSKKISLLFQEIVNNQTGEVYQYEVLSQVHGGSSSFGILEYLDELESSPDVYNRVVLSIFEQSFEIFNKNNIYFSINVSTKDLLNEKLLIDLELLFKKYPETTKRLTLEILESFGVETIPAINRSVTRLRYFGCKIALDDYGSSYSNLYRLINIDIDYLKLDGALIQVLDIDEKTYEAVRLIVQFCKRFKIKIIAEFVSSRELFELVRDLGIEYSQGYYFSKPTSEICISA